MGPEVIKQPSNTTLIQRLSFDQMESWKFFPRALTKVKTTLCTARSSQPGLSVFQMNFWKLLPQSLNMLYTLWKMCKAKPTLFISPFLAPSSLSGHTEHSADHFS